MSEKLDHNGPIDGMCFMGLNFSDEQFTEIQHALLVRMRDKPSEFAVECAVAEIVAELAEMTNCNGVLLEELNAQAARITRLEDAMREAEAVVTSNGHAARLILCTALEGE